MQRLSYIAPVFFICMAAFADEDATVKVRGTIVDAKSKEVLPARLYVQSADGKWFFPKSESEQGSAVVYSKKAMNDAAKKSANAVEMHTTLSAHPFVLELPRGKYTFTAERGKEYLTAGKSIEVGDQPLDVTIEMTRWIDAAALGWYSGDTHVHRPLNELPNVMLAEDLNVALPLSYWVTVSNISPRTNKKPGVELRPEVIRVDGSHVIYPINTEYEIFSTHGKQHTLGAVFVLNHKTVFEEGVPPVSPVAEHARREGAILDLDKHTWNWSLMIVPIMKVDLFELTNNHIWRTEFAFSKWTLDTAPKFMDIETDAEGFTERGWIDFGFKTYYALLNCGFRMRPSAGTASGVHPVPLGFGRVYVDLGAGQPLDYDKWMAALNAGRSFVTTGPMLFVQVNDQPPGSTIKAEAGEKQYRVKGSAESAVPLDRIEIIVNGKVAKTLTPANEKTPRGGFSSPIDASIPLDGSGWIAVRVFEARADKRPRFAHSSPVHIDVPGQPLRPRKAEAAYFVQRMEEEIARNQALLKPEELDEYKRALAIYQEIAKTARDE